MPQAAAVSRGCPLLMQAHISLRFYFHVALGHGVTCDLLHRNGEQVGFGAVHLLRRVKDVLGMASATWVAVTVLVGGKKEEDSFIVAFRKLDR